MYEDYSLCCLHKHTLENWTEVKATGGFQRRLNTLDTCQYVKGLRYMLCVGLCLAVHPHLMLYKDSDHLKL